MKAVIIQWSASTPSTSVTFQGIILHSAHTPWIEQPNRKQALLPTHWHSRRSSSSTMPQVHPHRAPVQGQLVRRVATGQSVPSSSGAQGAIASSSQTRVTKASYKVAAMARQQPTTSRHGKQSQRGKCSLCGPPLLPRKSHSYGNRRRVTFRQHGAWAIHTTREVCHLPCGNRSVTTGGDVSRTPIPSVPQWGCPSLLVWWRIVLVHCGRGKPALTGASWLFLGWVYPHFNNRGLRVTKFQNWYQSPFFQQNPFAPSIFGGEECGVDGNLKNGDQEKTRSNLSWVVPDPSYHRHLNSRLLTET